MNQQDRYPIRRRVQVPTLRHLFPQHPGWKQRNVGPRKVCTQIIKDLKHSFHANMIVNLSQHPLSPIETEVLNLGLSFVPTPTNVNLEAKTASIQRLMASMKRQFFFHNNDEEGNDKPAPHPFHTPTGWSPPEPMNEKLQTFFTKISDDVNRINDHDHLPNSTLPSNNRML